MRIVLVLIAVFMLTGCATGEPSMMPWFAARTLSPEEVEGFAKINESTKQRGCIRTHGNLAIYGQSGQWEKIACYGMEKEQETPYLDALKP